MERRSTLIIGLLLVLLGVWFLLVQFVPSIREWAGDIFSWPLIIIGVGIFLLLMGLLTGTPDMAVPACIVGGIGGILAYQNASGDWESWSYLWTLIPGFIAVGVILTGLLRGDLKKPVREGFQLLVVSAILFLVFASFMGGPSILGEYWPLLLVLLGLWILVRPLLARWGG